MEENKKENHTTEFTKEEVIQAVKNSFGDLHYASKKLKIDRAELASLIIKYKLKKLIDSEHEKIVDAAESKMLELIYGGSQNMIKFVLLTLGAGRGYKVISTAANQPKPVKPKPTIMEVVSKEKD